jgi:hypothetical protein
VPVQSCFERSPPPQADRLSKNQDIPRPFVFRAPQTQQTRFERGERFEFGLVLIGRALDFLPYFVLSFRELAREGLGLNRARRSLERVEELRPSSASFAIRNGRDLESQISNLQSALGRLSSVTDNPSPVPCQPSSVASLVYNAEDQLFRATAASTASDWIGSRLLQLSGGLTPGTWNPTPETRLVTHHSSRVTVRFLTPTFLRADGQVVRRPEFHHVFKRLRDRINALNTFFGNGPLDVDFRGLGERAEKVQMVRSKIEWVERFRTSSKTRQRHELSGFVGEAIYEGELTEFLPWLALGELVHIAKHAAWGNGRCELRERD